MGIIILPYRPRQDNKRAVCVFFLLSFSFPATQSHNHNIIIISYQDVKRNQSVQIAWETFPHTSEMILGFNLRIRVQVPVV